MKKYSPIFLLILIIYIFGQPMGLYSQVLYSEDFESGTAQNWIPRNPSRWRVELDRGDYAYSLWDTNIFGSSQQLNEWSVFSDYIWPDISFCCRARSMEDLTLNRLADYALLFRYQDDNNYYFAFFNSAGNETKLMKRFQGEESILAVKSSPTVVDNNYHEIEIKCVENYIEVFYDSQIVLSANDNSIREGTIGFGSRNDAVIFDDVRITSLGNISDENGRIQWSKTYGSRLNDRAVTGFFDGNYFYVYGNTEEVGSGAWLIKTCSDGNIVWQKFYDGYASIRASSMCKLTDGFLLCGSIQENARLLKVNNEGIIVWSKILADSSRSWATSVQTTLDNAFLLSGTTVLEELDSFLFPYINSWYMKINMSGDIEHYKNYRTHNWRDVSIEWNKIIQTPQGNFLFCNNDKYDYESGIGWTELKGFDSDFNPSFEHEYRYPHYDNPFACQLRQLKNGSILICGHVWRSGGLGWIINTDINGNILWESFIGQDIMGHRTVLWDIIETSDNKIMACGYKQEGYNADRDAFMVKLSEKGDVIWEERIGGSEADDANSIIEIEVGKYLLCGKTESYGYGQEDAWIVKFQENIDIAAQFSCLPNSGNVPLNVLFTDESLGEITSWLWDFGDGSTSTFQNPTHTFTTAGIYSVSLTVAGFSGSDTETKTDYITVEELHKISGAVRYHISNLAVPNVQLDFAPNGIVMQSDSQGLYEFTNLEKGNSYYVTPTKLRSTDVGTNIITSQDAYEAAQIAIGNTVAISYTMMASDVDNDGRILMYDAALIARYAAGIGMPSNIKTGEWWFNPDKREYPNFSQSWENQDYTGLVIGDVNFSWQKPTGSALAKAETRTVFHDANFVRIKLPANGFNRITSFDLTISYDAEHMVYKGLSNTHPCLQIIDNDQAGQLKIAAFATTGPIEIEFVLPVEIQFEVKNAGKSICIERYLLNDETQPLIEYRVNTAASLPDEFRVYQNYPNPFNPSTLIRFNLPWQEAQKTTVVIYDISGKKLNALMNQRLSAGEYVAEWNGRDENGNEVASGLYLCLLKSGLESRTIKLVKTK